MSNDVEIELKFPLSNGDEVEAFLHRHGTFACESSQHDVYYNAPHRNFLEDSDNVNEWFRVRVADGKSQINYKDFQPHGSKIKTHCKEYEANVDSYKQLARILEALDFTELVSIKKIRRSWEYMDTEVSIDAVEGLGKYIEIEYKGKSIGVQAARNHLFEVLNTLGAQTGDIDGRGYPYLMLEKQGLLTKLCNTDTRLAKSIGAKSVSLLKLAEDVVASLAAKNLHITTVESCTGGALADAITNISGSSEVLEDSFITYSNQAKIALGVPASVLERHTVYSVETALAMARAGLGRSVQANIGVGITGSLTRVDPLNQNSVPGTVYLGIVFGKTVVSRTLTIPQPHRAVAKVEIVKQALQVVYDVLRSSTPGE